MTTNDNDWIEKAAEEFATRTAQRIEEEENKPLETFKDLIDAINDLDAQILRSEDSGFWGLSAGAKSRAISRRREKGGFTDIQTEYIDYRLSLMVLVSERIKKKHE